jgi:hypothetical protein
MTGRLQARFAYLCLPAGLVATVYGLLTAS